MLGWLRERRNRLATARELYGSIVTQARMPRFYAGWGVPDTTQGRFEMIVLHVVLVLDRLEAEGAEGKRLGRALAETFVVDMDDAMREMTFGDLAVPREIKKAAAALYDRHKAYRRGREAGGAPALRAALVAQLGYLGAAQHGCSGPGRVYAKCRGRAVGYPDREHLRRRADVAATLEAGPALRGKVKENGRE